MNNMSFILSVMFGLILSSSHTTTLNNLDNTSTKDDVIANAHLGDGTTEILFNQLVADNDNNIYLDDNYSSYYYSELNNNFANNTYGSCGYVSLAMLLSFYDAYWDDSFISNTYDVTTTFSVSKQSGADFYLVPSNTESPGIEFEPSSLFENLNVSNYLTLAEQYEGTYFQYKLFDLAKDCLGAVNLDTSIGSMGLNSQNIYELLDYYLHNYKGFSESSVSVNFLASSNSMTLRSSTISKILSGTPVILVVKKPNTSSAHSVVAYDYNSSNGQIYVHTGWRDETSGTALTHVSLSDLGYSEIVGTISLNVNSAQSLGQKYFASSGEGYSASSFIFPREIKLVSGNFADMNPTFSWKSLFNEKWESNKNPYFTFSVLDSSKTSIFTVTNLRDTEYVLTTVQWDKVRFDIHGEKYYVLITLESDTYPYWDDYWCRVQFTKPDTYLNKPYIAPSEYDFEDAYPTDELTKNQFQSHTIRNFTFETRRYRVGYIHNEDIVMSPIRSGVNEAFIEYRFETAINRIDVDLSHWRELSKEWLSSSTGTASIQQYIEDEWINVLDLLANETDLSRNRNDKNTYKIEFLQPAYRIRFFSSYNSVVSSDSNRGRICIGNMAFYESEYNLPLSGGELEYEGNLWTSGSYNCYAYSLNTKQHGYMQPGGSEGHNYSNTANYLTKNVIVEMVGLDAENYEFTFEPIERNEKSSPNNYKVALVISPGVDYHWYRQNSDGTWSHKLASNPSQNCDSDDDLIYDPEYCNREYSYGLNYTQFCGFYEVNINQMI